ncbi:unnamed protein product [Nippostrongylus brasiliensis]|uniref:Reverse transcriptase domain-containing protein n=1 Tax=Nippostrongylus brasiliensis TaxID=27835 RepID=A0A0N4YV84_NIPBR|nr:unnamed protein product [Nippostrongylus brasiliensis]
MVLVGPKTNEIAPATLDEVNDGPNTYRQRRIETRSVGVAAWTRMKMVQMMNEIRESSYATKSKIVTKIPPLPSVSEPCLAMGIKPRKLETAGYNNAVVWDFIDTLQEYVKDDLKMPIFETVDNNKAREE